MGVSAIISTLAHSILLILHILIAKNNYNPLMVFIAGEKKTINGYLGAIYAKILSKMVFSSIISTLTIRFV